MTEHRAHARGRVGVFRALQTKERAVAVARSVHDYTDPACALPRAPFTASVAITGNLSGDEPHSFQDSRTVAVTATGDVRVDYRIAWTDAVGRGDVWIRVETVTGDAWYVQEQNLPAVAHTRRPDTARAVIRRGLDGVSVGLHAGRGRWETAPGGWRLGAAGHTFRGCLEEDETGWLRRLEADAHLTDATATLDAADRQFHGVWTLNAGRVMTLDIRERIRDAADPIAAPDRVGDVRRDRPYRDIERILGERLGLSEWKP